MSSIQQIVVKRTLKYKIVNDLILLFFKHNFFIFGGCVRDFILSKNKYYPYDFDIGVDNIDNAKEKLIDALEFCFNIESDDIISKENNVVHSKLKITYKHNATLDPLIFIIDISHKSIIGTNVDFDVNSIYMPNSKTFTLVDSISNTYLIDVIENINKRKFSIIKRFPAPQLSRCEEGIVNNSQKVLEFVKFMERTSKMLNRGWKLKKQNLTDVFDPCLIKEVQPDVCTLCRDTFSKYEIETNCCKKELCFTCAVTLIKTNYHNTEINCPFCRGDLFGRKTNHQYYMLQSRDQQTYDDALPVLELEEYRYPF